MFKFFLKCSMIVLVLFFGILLGMQHANQGIKEMKGYEDPTLYNAFNIGKSEEGKLEASVLGEPITSHNLEKKKEKLEEMKTYNFFSSMGKGLSETVSSGFRKITQTIIDSI